VHYHVHPTLDDFDARLVVLQSIGNGTFTGYLDTPAQPARIVVTEPKPGFYHMVVQTQTANPLISTTLEGALSVNEPDPFYLAFFTGTRTQRTLEIVNGHLQAVVNTPLPFSAETPIPGPM
jgi:hypothetical protein